MGGIVCFFALGQSGCTDPKELNQNEIVDLGVSDQQWIDVGLVNQDPVDQDPVDQDPIDQDPIDQDPIDQDLSLSDGPALYTEFCAFCHGNTGEGYLADQANALNNPTFLQTVDDYFLSQAIIHGRVGTPMSPWGQEKGGPLSTEDVEAIVEVIRSWQTEPTLDLEPLSQQGEALRGQGPYQAACASCHGVDGEGITALSLNQPWFLATISDEALAYAIEYGRPGTAMGAYGSILNSGTIADLVAYIRSWQRPVDSNPIDPFIPQIDQAITHPNGPLAEWTLRENRFVSSQQVFDAFESGQQLILIDARPSADYLDEHIQNAISLPFYLIEEYIDVLPTTVPIVTYCGCPHAISGQAADALIEAGFPSVAILDEGFYVWRDEFGYPTRTGQEVR
jgi:cytochrome c oxidase cbb3-type subunit 3/ubiquinol-cytochrome c reductase cytochrome c subunit